MREIAEGADDPHGIGWSTCCRGWFRVPAAPACPRRGGTGSRSAGCARPGRTRRRPPGRARYRRECARAGGYRSAAGRLPPTPAPRRCDWTGPRSRKAWSRKALSGKTWLATSEIARQFRVCKFFAAVQDKDGGGHRDCSSSLRTRGPHTPSAMARRDETSTGPADGYETPQPRCVTCAAIAGTTEILNPPPRPLPIGIAQAALEDLAGIFPRQVGLDFDVLWHLVVGQRHLELAADGSDDRASRPAAAPPPPSAPRRIPRRECRTPRNHARPAPHAARPRSRPDRC